MKTLKLLTSACRYCRNYKPEGRRGGMCQMLGVQVQGSWKACTVAIPTFAPAWEGLERIMLQEEKPVLPATCSQVSALDSSQLSNSVEQASFTPERKKTKAVLV